MTPAGQASMDGRCLSCVLPICKELYYENASKPWRTGRTQLRFCTTLDSMTSFAIQPFGSQLLLCWGFFFFLSQLNEIVCFIVCSKMCRRCEIKYDTSTEAPADVKKSQREVTGDSLEPHLSVCRSTLGQAVDV